MGKFPISPNYILKLSDIIDAKLIQDPSWYKKKNNYYFQVKTASQKSIFFLDNLDLARFWVNEIHMSMRFYSWFKGLIDKRYASSSPSYQEKADDLISLLQSIVLPEIDIDQYKIAMNISAE